jgi:hypothetical protein
MHSLRQRHAYFAPMSRLLTRWFTSRRTLLILATDACHCRCVRNSCRAPPMIPLVFGCHLFCGCKHRRSPLTVHCSLPPLAHCHNCSAAANRRSPLTMRCSLPPLGPLSQLLCGCKHRRSSRSIDPRRVQQFRFCRG